MSSDSFARGCIRLQMSMVNTVLELLNMDVMELINAASNAANIIPRTPAKMSVCEQWDWSCVCLNRTM